MTKYDGHCACGAVEWQAEIPADAQRDVLCHCRTCQLQSGAPYTLNQIIPKDNFKLTKGDLKVYTYKGESGNPVDCFFCANCTSSPYHHQHALGDKIVIRTGLLSGTKKWEKPVLEIFDKEKYSWEPQVGENTVPGGPPS